MKTWSKLMVVTVAGCLSALLAGAPAHAAEITVVAGGGPLPDVLGTLMPMFEKATGNKVKISSKGGPEIAADLKAGAAILARGPKEDDGSIDARFVLIGKDGLTPPL